MPSFGRLGKQSNRSQHAVAEPPPLPSGISAASASASVASNSGSLPGGPGPGSGPGPGPGPGSGAGAAGGAATAEADSPADATPQSALSKSALSSNESFVDTRQQAAPQKQSLQTLSSLQVSSQLQQQQQQSGGPPPPPSHLYHAGASSSSASGPNPSSLLQNPAAAGIGASPVFDGRSPHPQQQQQQQQQQQHSGDFSDLAAAVTRHSQRFSASFGGSAAQSHSHHQQPQQQPQQQQQQQLYGGAVSQTSLDDLSSYHQSQVGPPPQAAAHHEKRSTRKLIKGIFSGRSNHDNGRDNASNQQRDIGPPPTYDNTSGLARRPSKRISNPPVVKTGLSPSSQFSSDREWHAPGSGTQQHSPLNDLGETDEYNYVDRDSARRIPPQDPRIIPPINTIREVLATDELSSPYEENIYHPPPHPPPNHQQKASTSSQQHVGVQQGSAPLDQQNQFDAQQGVYDAKQLPAPPSQYYTANSPLDQYQQGDPRFGTAHLGPGSQGPQLRQQNAETISQLSRESPVPDSDQRSLNQQLEQPSPAVAYSGTQSQDPASALNLPPVQTVNQSTTPQAPTMSPPASGAPASRRATDTDKALPGAPPGYRPANNSNMIPTSPLPGTSSAPAAAAAAAGQPPAFQGTRGQQYEGAAVEQGRNSPQPSTTTERENAESEKQFKELLTKYKNVKRLYFDGKSQIEQLNGQVEHLQNAVANQRMSQSRTALDDNEYVNRFNRLNGAINNLSFNIRKDWHTLPPWIEKFVSPDALKTGKQEMTAVGRAVVSKWVVEEIFNKCFHPGLDAQLSAQLKEIELSIRGNSYTLHSQEEFDALTTKVVNWRMATLDGLQAKLNSTATPDNRVSLITKATTNLTAGLYQYLNDPPPPGVEGSTSMIVELAVGIASNLPMESRDVSIMYPLPMDALQQNLMEVEKAGLPALDGQKHEGEAESEASEKDKNGSSSKIVRFAGFMALEVRGRQVLMKAPVWVL